MMQKIYKWPKPELHKRKQAIRSITRHNQPTIRRVSHAIQRTLERTESSAQKIRALSRLKWAATLAGLEAQTKDLFKTASRHLRQRAPAPVKAWPLTPGDAKALIAQCQIQQVAAIMLIAYLTASRIDDVVRVRGIPTSGGMYLIDFTKTKARRERQPREDHQVLIPEDALPTPWQKLITQWQPIKSTERPRVKRLVSKILAQFNGKAQPPCRADRRQRYTLHSFKRGAVECLMEAAAEGHIRPHLVSVMAKHKRAAPTIEPTTIGYSDRPELVAKMMDTHTATRYLATQLRQS